MKQGFQFLLVYIIIAFASLQVKAQSGVWTWMKGSNTGLSVGNYGVKGVSAPTNEPPARYQTAYWTDQNGDLWLFGGVVSGACTMIYGVIQCRPMNGHG